MTENTIKTYEAFIKNHHTDKIFDCVERAYSLWNRQHRGIDDVKFLTFMKEKGITDDDLWIPLAAGMLKVWIKMKIFIMTEVFTITKYVVLLEARIHLEK